MTTDATKLPEPTTQVIGAAMAAHFAARENGDNPTWCMKAALMAAAQAGRGEGVGVTEAQREALRDIARYASLRAPTDRVIGDLTAAQVEDAIDATLARPAEPAVPGSDARAAIEDTKHQVIHMARKINSGNFEDIRMTNALKRLDAALSAIGRGTATKSIASTSGGKAPTAEAVDWDSRS